jgi:hypothetical protein
VQTGFTGGLYPICVSARCTVFARYLDRLVQDFRFRRFLAEHALQLRDLAALGGQFACRHDRFARLYSRGRDYLLHKLVHQSPLGAALMCIYKLLIMSDGDGTNELWTGMGGVMRPGQDTLVAYVPFSPHEGQVRLPDLGDTVAPFG